MTEQELINLIAWNAKAIEKLAIEADKRAIEADKRAVEADKRAIEADKRGKELDEKIKKLEINLNNTIIKLDWMWVTQWEISEEIIYENFKSVFAEIWENISSTQRNIEIFENKRKIAEFDIIAVNWTKVFVWETKTRLNKSHVEKFLNKTIPNFKKYLWANRYIGMDVYWVLWTRIFANEEVKDLAINNGIYLIKEYHNWNTKFLKESLVKAKAL